MKKVKVDPSKRILLDIESNSARKKMKTSEASENENDSSRVIVKPHPHDVLCGRGNFANYHGGNEFFRELVKNYKFDYVSCVKSRKKGYSQLVYDKIRERDPPGRFLKYDARLNIWTDIGEKRALEKTRQALREGAPEILKVLSPDQKPNDSAAKTVALKDEPSAKKKMCLHEKPTIKSSENISKSESSIDPGNQNGKDIGAARSLPEAVSSNHYQVMNAASTRGILLHEAAGMLGKYRQEPEPEVPNSSSYLKMPRGPKNTPETSSSSIENERALTEIAPADIFKKAAKAGPRIVPTRFF